MGPRKHFPFNSVDISVTGCVHWLKSYDLTMKCYFWSGRDLLWSFCMLFCLPIHLSMWNWSSELSDTQCNWCSTVEWWGKPLSQKLTQVSTNRRRLWYGRNWRRMRRGSERPLFGACSAPVCVEEEPGRGQRKKRRAGKCILTADESASQITLTASVRDISSWALWQQS